MIRGFVNKNPKQFGLFDPHPHKNRKMETLDIANALNGKQIVAKFQLRKKPLQNYIFPFFVIQVTHPHQCFSIIIGLFLIYNL